MNRKRDSLKKIVGISSIVSVLPNTWIKPVVSTVVLPVHAQTSIRFSCTITAEINQGVGTATVTITPAFEGVSITLETHEPFGSGSILPGFTRLTDENGMATFNIAFSGQVPSGAINVYLLNLNIGQVLTTDLDSETVSCSLPLTF